jgi:hypothetical protein
MGIDYISHADVKALAIWCFDGRFSVDRPLRIFASSGD